MKRLLFASLLMIVAIAVCAVECVVIKRSVSEMKGDLAALEQCFYDGKSAKEAADRLENSWNKYSGLLSLFVDHETVDEISRLVCGLKTGFDYDKYRFKASLCDMNFLLDDLMDTEKVSLDGLF